MKIHSGVDDVLGLVHGVATTSANTHDVAQIDWWLHGEEERV
ncbi:MAG: hypothetical protein V3T17_01995 [Pseudomonadales bacterium]